MTDVTYVAELQPEDCGGYSVHFPDLPGAISEGDSESEAIRNARDALESVLDHLEAVGKAPPPPSHPVLLSAEIVARGNLPSLITVQRATRQKVNLALDSSLVERIDEAARAAGLTRSDWISQTARAALGR